MALDLPTHTLIAFNTATSSENKIHDDEVAGALGFGGGLVPGVDVYAYLCQPAVARWGIEFLTRGRAATRFGTPTYDGQQIEIDIGTRGQRVELGLDGNRFSAGIGDFAGGGRGI